MNKLGSKAGEEYLSDFERGASVNDEASDDDDNDEAPAGANTADMNEVRIRCGPIPENLVQFIKVEHEIAEQEGGETQGAGLPKDFEGGL